MLEVGIREIKNNLSRYLKLVREGDFILVTDRGIPVARIMPVEDRLPEEIMGLLGKDLSVWKGGKPRGAATPPVLRKGRTLAEIVTQDRR